MVASALLTGARALGQAQNTGTIYGSVIDPTGAVVSGAQVVAAESSLGVNRTVKTSKAGEFNLPSLPVGTYTLTVTGEGFQTYVADTITVDADASVKLNVKMTIGDQKETVQVDAEGTALDTRSAQLGALIDNKMVEDLPIDGRNVVALAGLLPGVTDLNAPTSTTNDKLGQTYSVSGSRNTQNLQLFDGLMWNNLFLNTGIAYPPPNGLQEISVLLNNFKAQYGRNAGSVFNVVTKRGTNTIHGEAWEYLQNQMFNASDYITQRNPKDNTNIFGFTVGGPIKTDKLFYQVTFQAIVQHLQNIGVTPTQTYLDRGFNPGSTSMTPDHPCTTPGPVYSTGICANFQDQTDTTANGVATYGKFYNPLIYSSSSGLQAGPSDAISMFQSAAAQNPVLNSMGVNKWTGGNPANCLADLQTGANYAASHNYLDGKSEPQYLPNAEVPASCLNPQISELLYKYVGFPTTLSANGQLNNISVAPLPQHNKNFTVRSDWTATQRHQIDMRYNLINSDDLFATGVSSASLGISTYDPSVDHAISNYGNIGDTWLVSQNVLNVLRVGYKRYVFTSPPLDNTTWNDLGGNFVEPGVPTLPVVNASNEYSLGNISQSNATVTNEDIEVLEQLTWTKGKHNFQFGGNYLHLQYLNRTDYPGKFSYSSTFSGYSYADEAMGLLTSIQANSPLVQGGIQNDIFAYAQDDWRIASRLTVNLGARYELPFQWYQPNGYASTFVAGYQSQRFPGAIGGLAFPGDTGIRKSLVPTDFNGIVPRIGLAYDVFGTGKFVARAGFGMFFDAINANVIGVGEPFYFQVFKNLPPGGTSVPLAGFGPNNSILQIPSGYTPNSPQFFAPYSLFYPDRNFRTPYYEATNIGFEYKPVRNGVLDVNYVGKFGRKQTIGVDQNPAITACSGGYYQANPALYANPYCPYYVPGSVAGNASSQVSSTLQRLRYTPFNYGGQGLVDYESAATSNYNALQALYTQRGGKKLQLTVSYTYSKSIDLQTSTQQLPGPQNVIPDVFNIASERGLSDYDSRHVLNMGWVLYFPVTHTGFRGLDAVLSSWAYGGIFNARTGRPYNLTINNDSALDAEPDQRPALLPGANPYLSKNRHRTDRLKQWFNTDAFTYPSIGTFSSVPRNFLIGPAYLNTQMDIQRYFSLAKIREGMRLQFRADAFNVFNTPNLQNPKSQFSCTTTSIQTPGNALYGLPCRNAAVGGSFNATFGVVQSTYGTNGNTSTNGRKMQFSTTVYF
jgi:hypothetical protein